jgi:hypothetical protein
MHISVFCKCKFFFLYPFHWWGERMKGSSLNEIDSRCDDLEPPIKTRAVRMLKLVVVGDAVGLNVRIRQKFDSEEEYLI